MAWIKNVRPDNYAKSSRTWIWANSLDLTTGRHFLKAVAGWIVDKATAWTRIVWVNYTEKLFASDNQTVAQIKVEYEPSENNVWPYEVEITWGTITADDENLKWFNLTDSDTVDGTTESTIESYVDTVAWTAFDPVIKYQVKLVKFISATKWEFIIVV